MREASRTIVALLTPRGRGAIASVMVRGPEAVSAVDQFFAPHGRVRCSTAPIGRVLVGRWHDGTTPHGKPPTESSGEELVVCRTGLDQIEVHCHGGRAAAAAIIDALRQLGCDEVDWPEAPWMPTESPLQNAARMALATARTERTAAILLDQYNGALERSLEQFLVELSQTDRSAAISRLDELLKYHSLSLHLTRAWEVVLAGPPNVGKSSLINAIMGFQRTVVVDDPGTTRDVVTATTAIDGWPVRLSDTAGLREALEPLEAAGISRARERLDSSDLIVLVLDPTLALSTGDQELLAQYPDAIVVANKCDLAPAAGAIPSHAIRTSALTRVGLDELLHVLSQRLVPHAPRAGEAVPFAQSHIEALSLAHDALQGNQWQCAEQHVKRLLAG